MNLPHGVPQEILSQDRYEFIPLPKMIYDNYVPLIATRRIVYRRPTPSRVNASAPFQQQANASSMASKLPEVEEMSFQF